MKTIGKAKTVGVLNSKPTASTNDGRIIYHASNSRRFRCLCGKLFERWENNQGQSVTRLVCSCERTHRRGNFYFD